MNIENVLKKQKKFYSKNTIDYRRKRAALLKLKRFIKMHANAISTCLKKDLNKSKDECLYTELKPLIDIINDAIRLLDNHTLSKGSVLIASNYTLPFYTPISHLIYAISAGNTVVLRPSYRAKHTSYYIYKMINHIFDEEYIYCAGYDVSYKLLKSLDFDGKYIVGKQEFSPVIIDGTFDFEESARKIVFSKFTDAGQSQNTFDYILVDSSIKKLFISSLVYEIENQIGTDPLIEEGYANIIDKRAYDYILDNVNMDHSVYGGAKCEKTLQIGPIVLDEKTIGPSICGPVYTIVGYDDLGDILGQISQNEVSNLFVFTDDEDTISKINKYSFAKNVYINDTIVSDNVWESISSYCNNLK